MATINKQIMRAALAAFITTIAAAQQADEAKSQIFKGGGDLRLRLEAFDDIPIIADPPGVTRSGENSYFRIRPRLWGSAAWEGITLYGRVANEFRHYLEPDTPSAWDWPDEIIVDQLYLDMPNLLDGRVGLRAGRQDMIYGAGRVILEGTPKDGSRTIYFDAVKISLNLGPNDTVDLLGIYNRAEAGLEIGPLDRDNTGFDRYDNDMTESGGGVYARLRRASAMPLDVYYLLKDESRWKGLAGQPAEPVRHPGRQTHTVGARLLPRLNDQVGFELEGAGQFGETDDDRDIAAMMGYGGVIWTLPAEIAGVRPSLTASLYYLSGDDPDTDKEEGWNPLWSRYPQFSELYIYAFDAEKAGYWSNVLYPSVTAAIAFDKSHKVSLSAGVLFAPEETGPGGGDRRGNLFTARYDFPLATALLHRGDRLVGHLLAEMLDPGDYYRVDDRAYFVRGELAYSF